MSLDQTYSRIDTLELKALIVKRIGVQRAEKYLDHLRRLFSLKLTKCEFNKLCLRTIGRENLSLHNKLIRSIAKNACLSKVPPTTRGARKPSNNGLNVKIPNGPHKSHLQSPPRRGQSPASRDRKLRDRPSPLGPLGKQQQQQQHSATELVSLGSRPPTEAPSVEDGEEVEQESPGAQSRSPVTAPFGVSMNVPRKALSNNNNNYINSNNNVLLLSSLGELPDTGSLRNRVRRKLEAEGVAGVSVDCVNVLNSSLDAYLKRLIEPCTRLAGARRAATVLDFRAAMELNPRLLGEDWAVQFEKIGFRASQE